MKGTIVFPATLDTKGQESQYIKNLIKKNGYNVITIDVGTGARGDLLFPPDYPREAVAKAAGSSMEEILDLGKKGKENLLMDMMAQGAAVICKQLLKDGKLDGIISIGGSMGTNLGTKIMKALPFGIPKVMLSTYASGDISHFIGTKDIAMLPSIADIAGLNSITGTTMAQAAGAIMGMVAVGKVKSSGKPQIGITTIGGTTGTAMNAKKWLEGKGFEVIIFHANGPGGKSMDEMVKQGLIQATLDLSPSEIVDNIYDGMNNSGPERMEAAGKMGVPQLVVPGNIDHIIYSSPEQIPERFKSQRYHMHGPHICVLRTKKKEMLEVAEVMAKKLNQAKGETAVLFPLQGISVLDKIVEEFYEPETNLAFFDALEKLLKPEIEVRRMDVHITDAAFAETAAEMLYELIQRSGSKTRRKA
jgi:uncharacterized protein (UPF0261 family)